MTPAGMHGCRDILACYAELAGTVASMLERARDHRWSELPGLDAQCAALFEQLRALDDEGVSGADHGRIAWLAGRIRADQAELRACMRPQFEAFVGRMAQLHHAS